MSAGVVSLKNKRKKNSATIKLMFAKKVQTSMHNNLRCHKKLNKQTNKKTCLGGLISGSSLYSDKSPIKNTNLTL